MGRGMGLGKSVMEFSFLTLLGGGWDKVWVEGWAWASQSWSSVF